MKWPWCRRKEHLDNEHAAQAKAEAAAAVEAAQQRWPEVHHAKNVFAAEVERAWRRRQA